MIEKENFMFSLYYSFTELKSKFQEKDNAKAEFNILDSNSYNSVSDFSGFGNDFSNKEKKTIITSNEDLVPKEQLQIKTWKVKLKQNN
jgi:hypothetical protein